MGVFKREGLSLPRAVEPKKPAARAQPKSPRGAAGAAGNPTGGGPSATSAAGDAAEARALHWLQARGLMPVARNYRVARGPSARGGEVDLILRESDGTLVFVEVRARADARHGGAAASVGAAKQRRIVYAAQHYLMRMGSAPPPCRFDVLALDGDEVQWIQGAFDAG